MRATLICPEILPLPKPVFRKHEYLERDVGE
jgi:hypothetical protein